MSSVSPTEINHDLSYQQTASVAEQLSAAPPAHGLRARLRRATQQLLDQLDEHWDNNETLAHSWPTCC